MRGLQFFILLFLLGLFTCACGKDDKPDPKPIDQDTSGFAEGADVSWVTEMENEAIFLTMKRVRKLNVWRC